MEEQHTISAWAAGTLTLGKDLVVNRLGFGAMQLPGPGVWGEPASPEEAKAVLHRAVELGVNFIDTAAFYGPEVANRFIQEALYPYPEGLVIATKVGAKRGKDQSWSADMRPERLRAACEENIRQLRLDPLPLVHCRYMEDADVPFGEAVGTLAELQRKGMIRHIGVSNVSLQQLREAQAVTSIVSVQNFYNFAYRQGEDLFEVCRREQIAFIPAFPLAMGQFEHFGSRLDALAQRYHATTAQTALAWLLTCSPIMLPIPGTSSRVHLEENIAAAGIRFTEEEMMLLEDHGSH
ncbi:oxidoreductase [Ktedonosporobacter rubrisoli]|uniref:Oxidoreductase n=2 Tax=Ktedonosporobacter rubrisoli TaxID=2509675 RepID=A0A4P6K5L1_KTERU|nr:oxidoreductase [Ktedonosporobacter rubrisoli]